MEDKYPFSYGSREERGSIPSKLKKRSLRRLALSLAILTLASGVAMAADGATSPAAAPITATADAGAELFELRIYTAAPGKLEVLNKRFREHTLKLFEKHGIRSVGYWTAIDEKHQGRLYYIIAYPDKESREKMLVDGIAKDPEFLKAVAESEKDGRLTTETESVQMLMTDYSPTLTVRHTPKENSMLSKVPVPVMNYLAAEKAKDADKLSACFATSGIVNDEGKDYRGIDAIKMWKQRADAKYQYVMEPIDISGSDKTVDVRAKLTGTFPGSPVELRFTFTLTNDKIESLDVR